MADSGVDTSNEIESDSSQVDQQATLFRMVEPPSPMEHNDLSSLGEYSNQDNAGKIKKPYTRKCRHTIYNIYSSTNRKLRLAAYTNNAGLVEKLLSQGADPNSSDEFKRSPLHLAACRGYVNVVRTLLKHGANPNVKDDVGNTPLHLAACTNHVPVVINLLDAGTDVSTNDKNGRNPIQLAQSKLKIIQMKTSGTPEEKQKMLGEIALVVEMMLKYMKARKVNTDELESVRQRLERLQTRQQVDCEVQNLLDSLDSLKLK